MMGLTERERVEVVAILDRMEKRLKKVAEECQSQVREAQGILDREAAKLKPEGGAQ